MATLADAASYTACAKADYAPPFSSSALYEFYCTLLSRPLGCGNQSSATLDPYLVLAERNAFVFQPLTVWRLGIAGPRLV